MNEGIAAEGEFAENAVVRLWAKSRREALLIGCRVLLHLGWSGLLQHLLDILDDFDGRCATVLSAEQTQQMLYSLEVVRRRLDNSDPALFGLFSAIESEKRGGQVGSRFEMARLNVEHFVVPA